MQAIIGGSLIGLSVSIMLVFNGRVTGISGMFYSTLTKEVKSEYWKIIFLVGLVLGGMLYFTLTDTSSVPSGFDRPLYIIALSGILVGFGARLGSGCTSGHGICGTSRLSVRSIASTLTFISAGAITVFLYNLLTQGVNS